AAIEWQRILRSRRFEWRPRFAVQVRRLRIRRRLRYWSFDTRRHEHELRVILLRRERELCRPLSGYEQFRKVARREENRNHHQQMEDDRQQDDFQPRQCAPDDGYVGVIILEIEIHEGVTSSIAVGLPSSLIKKDGAKGQWDCVNLD